MKDKIESRDTKEELKKLVEFDQVMDKGHNSTNYHAVVYTNGELLDDKHLKMELYDINRPTSANRVSIEYSDKTWTYVDEGMETTTIRIDDKFKGYEYTNVDPYAIGSSMYDRSTGSIADSRYSYPFAQQLVNFIQAATKKIDEKQYEAYGLTDEMKLLEDLQSQADRLQSSIEKSTEQLTKVNAMIAQAKGYIATKAAKASENKSHDDEER